MGTGQFAYDHFALTPVVEITQPDCDMVVICHIPEGGLSPLLQALSKGGGDSREGALTTAYATCLITQ